MRDRFRRCLGVDGFEPRPAAGEVSLYRIDREIEHGGDFFQRLVEHVLEDHDAALHGRKLCEPRHRCFDRLPPHHRLHRIWNFRIGKFLRRLDGLSRADRTAAQEIKRTVVGDTKQPGAHWRALLQLVERDEGAGESVLHYILAIDHRAHQPRAVAVELRPQLFGERQELCLSRRWRLFGWRGRAQAATPSSSTVIPVSPLRPKATPSAYFGSSRSETTFSPNSRGGSGAPKRARNCSGFMPMARA